VLVNAHSVNNVSGRKSDVLGCQWRQQLMSYGLLSAAFHPAEGVCALRAVSRQRDTLLQEQARCVRRMQKALTLINVQLANASTPITGQTGLAIIRAIVAGERNPQALAKRRNYRVKASAADLAKSLEGTWQEEHLFCLGHALSLYDA
jgi:transposase